MTERDGEREERIERRIIVDTYTREEQAYGWHAYLADTLEFPFETRCTSEREESPLMEGETVQAVGMATTEPTLTQQYVTVAWIDRELSVPLKQLEPVDASEATEQAIADWQYWLER
jgi:hypothetical protein